MFAHTQAITAKIQTEMEKFVLCYTKLMLLLFSRRQDEKKNKKLKRNKMK